MRQRRNAMSYCVNCGVELDPTASTCPLCHTPVVNPRQPVDTELPPTFPASRAEVQPAPPRRRLALLLTAMLVVGGRVLRAAEPVSAPRRPSLVPVRHRGGGDAVGLVRPCPWCCGGCPVLFRLTAGCGGRGHLCLAHLHRPGRRRLVPGAGPAHDRAGLGVLVLSSELSAPGRAAVHPVRHYPGHRGGWAFWRWAWSSASTGIVRGCVAARAGPWSCWRSAWALIIPLRIVRRVPCPPGGGPPPLQPVILRRHSL